MQKLIVNELPVNIRVTGTSAEDVYMVIDDKSVVLPRNEALTLEPSEYSQSVQDMLAQAWSDAESEVRVLWTKEKQKQLDYLLEEEAEHSKPSFPKVYGDNEPSDKFLRQWQARTLEAVRECIEDYFTGFEEEVFNVLIKHEKLQVEE